VFTRRFPPEPVDHPYDIHRRRIHRLLHVRTCQANVAATPQLKAPCALGEGAFYTGPQRILFLERGRGLTFMGRLDGLMEDLRFYGNLARVLARRGTRWARRTRLTRGFVKSDADHGMPLLTVPGCPFDTAVSLGTVCLLGFPIDREGMHVVPLAFSPLTA